MDHHWPFYPLNLSITDGMPWSPLPGDRHGGFGERPGKRTESNPDTAPQADSTKHQKRSKLRGS